VQGGTLAFPPPSLRRDHPPLKALFLPPVLGQDPFLSSPFAEIEAPTSLSVTTLTLAMLSALWAQVRARLTERRSENRFSLAAPSANRHWASPFFLGR